MFRLEVRKELVRNAPSDEGGIWVENESLLRDDGVRLDIIATGRELKISFVTPIATSRLSSPRNVMTPIWILPILGWLVLVRLSRCIPAHQAL
jgi:hypothetical protein